MMQVLRSRTNPACNNRNQRYAFLLLRVLVVLLLAMPLVSMPQRAVAATGDLLSAVPVVDENTLNNAACGVAAATMVLDYYKTQAHPGVAPLTLKAVVPYVQQYAVGGRIKGSTTDEIQTGIERASTASDLGVSTPLTATWSVTNKASWFSVLQGELDQQRPVIVYLADGHTVWPTQSWHYGHFIVVSGYTADQGIIYHDPWDGQAHTMSNAAFGAAWGTTWGPNPPWWYMTVLPASVTPPPLSPAPASWIWRNPLPQGNPLDDISCPSTSLCVAVGFNGTILTSTDGGTSWVSRPSGTDNNLSGVSCPNTRLCVAVSSKPSDLLLILNLGFRMHFVSTIVTSTDGGSTWISHSSGTGTSLSGISCPSTSLCVAVGESGTITSTDGGATWISHSSGTGTSLSGISCPSTSLCVAVGESGAITSTDGGTTWISHSSGTGTSLSGISCPSTSLCVAVVLDSIAISTDGGSTWTRQPSATTAGQGSDLSGISCPSTSLCVAVGNGAIVTSTDGGSTWIGHSSGTGTSPSGISCPSMSLCVAVSSSGAIVTSTDGGSSWTSQSSGLTSDLSGISCPSTSLCVAVGSSGAIVTSTDGGSSWTSQSSGLTSDLSGISCPSTSLCMAVGSSGAIVTSTDGGSSWTSQSSGLTSDLSGISCPSTSLCVAVGSSGTILTSTDGGSSWTSRSSGTNKPLVGVHCPSTSLCMAVGSSGAIVTSTDGGSSWTSRSSGTNKPLVGVHCPSMSLCMAVGSSGTILTSTDGGSSWTSRSSGLTSDLSGISCPSTSLCVVVGNSQFFGLILTSTDGGISWTSRTAVTFNGLTSVNCQSTNMCLIGGTGGTILQWQAKGAKSVVSAPTPVSSIPTALPRTSTPISTSTSSGIANPSFKTDISAIFQAHCAACHIVNQLGGLSLATYAGLVKGGSIVSGSVIVPGRHAKSVLWQIVSAQGPWPGGNQMPLGGPYLSKSDVQTIAKWIDQGAKNDQVSASPTATPSPNAAATASPWPTATATIQPTVSDLSQQSSGLHSYLGKWDSQSTYFVFFIQWLASGSGISDGQFTIYAGTEASADHNAYNYTFDGIRNANSIQITLTPNNGGQTYTMYGVLQDGSLILETGQSGLFIQPAPGQVTLSPGSLDDYNNEIASLQNSGQSNTNSVMAQLAGTWFGKDGYGTSQAILVIDPSGTITYTVPQYNRDSFQGTFTIQPELNQLYVFQTGTNNNSIGYLQYTFNGNQLSLSTHGFASFEDFTGTKQ